MAERLRKENDKFLYWIDLDVNFKQPLQNGWMAEQLSEIVVKKLQSGRVAVRLSGKVEGLLT